MSKLTITTVELNGEVIQREMTNEEAQELKAMQEKWLAEEKAVNEILKAKAAIYEKLGLSAEEIALLVK